MTCNEQDAYFLQLSDDLYGSDWLSFALPQEESSRSGFSMKLADSPASDYYLVLSQADTKITTT